MRCKDAAGAARARAVASYSHPMKRFVGSGVLAIVALAFLVMTGCRGSLGPPLSEWRVKADEICKTVQEEADKTRPVLFEPSLAQTLRKSSDYSRSEAQQLRALDKPSDRRETVRDYLAALDDRNRELELVASQAEHPGLDFKPPSLEKLAAETEKATNLAKDLDLKDCRSGVDVSVAGAPQTTTTGVPDPNAPPTSPVPDPTDLDNETQDQLG